MKRFLGTILVIIFLVACGKKTPKGIFSEEKMTDVLFDVHLADSYGGTLYGDTSKSQNADAYFSIYKKYNSDSAQLRENIEYYSEHPQDLQDIYAEITKRLQSEERRLQKEESDKQREDFKLDSIRGQRVIDSLNLIKRDSIVNFHVKRDLFLHSPDSLMDSLAKPVLIDSVFKPILNEQRRWEMIFYYFGDSRFPIRPPSLQEQQAILPPEPEESE